MKQISTTYKFSSLVSVVYCSPSLPYTTNIHITTIRLMFNPFLNIILPVDRNKHPTSMFVQMHNNMDLSIRVNFINQTTSIMGSSWRKCTPLIIVISDHTHVLSMPVTYCTFLNYPHALKYVLATRCLTSSLLHNYFTTNNCLHFNNNLKVKNRNE